MKVSSFILSLSLLCFQAPLAISGSGFYPDAPKESEPMSWEDLARRENNRKQEKEDGRELIRELSKKIKVLQTELNKMPKRRFIARAKKKEEIKNIEERIANLKKQHGLKDEDISSSTKPK